MEKEAPQGNVSCLIQLKIERGKVVGARQLTAVVTNKAAVNATINKHGIN